MKYFVCYMVILFVIVFGGIAFANYTLDPGHVYHSQKYIDKVIEGIKEGYNVEGITDIDERLYKLRFAELHKGERFDYCKDFNIRFSNVIIAADPSLFNGHYVDDRWKCLGDYVNEFMGKDVTGQRMDWDLVWNLFSVSYFKTALSSCMTDDTNLKYVKTVINEGETFRTDGSFCWSKSVREAPKSVIDEKVQNWHFHLYKNFTDLSNERVVLFTKLLDCIKADGTKIYLLRSPYHPNFYKKLLKLKGATAAFDFIDSYAKKNDIPLIGSFNPADEGLNGSDFYDGPHVRKEVLDKIVERELFI